MFTKEQNVTASIYRDWKGSFKDDDLVQLSNALTQAIEDFRGQCKIHVSHQESDDGEEIRFAVIKF